MRRAAAAALLVAGIVLPGCAKVESEAVEVYEPAKLQAVKGSELKQVTLTPEAAKRIGVRTASVRRSGGRRVVPYSALLYDGTGRTYVYVTPKPLSFVRAAVAVDRIEGASALLRDGPPVGSRVVTTGTSEVLGTELDVAGSE
jgi:hypothetical protein